MPFEPTEELFDNLMQRISTSKDYADSESEDYEDDGLIYLNEIQSHSVEIQSTFGIRNLNTAENRQNIHFSTLNSTTILSNSHNSSLSDNFEQFQNSNNFDEVLNLTQHVNDIVHVSEDNTSDPDSTIIPASEDVGQNGKNEKSDTVDTNLKLNIFVSKSSIESNSSNEFNPSPKLSDIPEKSCVSLPQFDEQGLSVAECSNNQETANKSIDIDQNKKIFDCIDKISAEADNPSCDYHVNKISSKIVLVDEMTSDESEVESGESSILNITEKSQSFTHKLPKPLEMLETVDLVKPFGMTLDPSSTDNYESVETITIDANQKTQDEEEDIEVLSDDSIVSNVSSLSCVEIFDESSTDRLLKELPNDSPCKSDTKDSKASETNDSNKSQNSLLNGAPNDKSSNLNQQDKETEKYLKKLRIFSNLTSALSKEVKESNNNKTKLEVEEGSKLKCRRYDCRGCDSKFWILRFYYQHISRVTAKIMYDCKECEVSMKFTNPCLLKIHVKSHGSSTNSVKMSESNLNVELPSMTLFRKKYLLEFQPAAMEKSLGTSKENDDDLEDNFICPECRVSTPSLVEHLMYKPYSSSPYFHCSSCEFIFSSRCALLMHKRIHNSQRPYNCPECGTSFVTQNRLLAHLSVECYHFRRCLLSKCFNCGVILPDKTTLKNHMLTKHRSVVYKCEQCPDHFKIVSDFHTHVREKHNLSSKVEMTNIFDKCDLCSVKGRIFPHSDYGDHLSQHMDDVSCVFFGYRCRKCKFLAQNPVLFHNHMDNSLVCKMNEDVAFKQSYPSISHPLKKRKCEEYCNPIIKKKFCYIYSAHQDSNKEEEVINRRDSVENSDKVIDFACNKSDGNSKPTMFCLLCSKQFPGSSEIRQHINIYHKCEDYRKYVQVSLDIKESEEKKDGMRIDDEDTNSSDYENLDSNSDSDESNKCRDPLSCPHCEYIATSKDDFRTHVIKHRHKDDFQCLECGQCFVCRSSLEIHLVSVHSVKDTISYISMHFVHNSLPVGHHQNDIKLRPNQCSVCFIIFSDEKALKFHFRCHGMAFLRRNYADLTPSYF